MTALMPTISGDDQIDRHCAEEIAVFTIEANPALGAIRFNREPMLEDIRLPAVWANAPRRT